MTRTVTRKSLLWLGAAALSASLLAGCGSAQVGAAAVIGDRRISVSDVQSATVDAQAWVGQGTQITPTQVLYFLAVAPYVQEIAGKYGVGTSADDALASLKTRVKSPSAAGVEVIRANASLGALQQRLGEQQASEALAEATKRLVADGFVMNPRFGTFDSKTGRVTMPQPNWLTGSADEGAPAGAPAPAN